MFTAGLTFSAVGTQWDELKQASGELQRLAGSHVNIINPVTLISFDTLLIAFMDSHSPRVGEAGTAGIQCCPQELFSSILTPKNRGSSFE